MHEPESTTTRATRRRQPRLGRLALTAAVVAAAACGSLGGGAASADSLSSDLTQAIALQHQLDANGERISALGEQYDAAVLHLQQAQQRLADAGARQASTRAQLDRLVAVVRARAGALYRDTVAGRPLSDYAVGNASDLGVRQGYAHAQARQDAATLTQLQRTQASLDAEEADAGRAARDAAAEASTIAAARDALAAANARQTELVAQAQGPLAPVVAQVAARQEATAATAAQQQYGASTPTTPTSGAPGPPTLPPEGSGAPVAGSHPARALLAIAFARAQLGKPYVYAAAGPDTYDCSGLTMAAYAAAGLRLPHYSGAQYAMLPHVPLNRLLPGDLLFWGPGGSEHVALYIGDGLMIHAPHTGDVVRVAPVFATPVGAARPW